MPLNRGDRSDERRSHDTTVIGSLCIRNKAAALDWNVRRGRAVLVVCAALRRSAGSAVVEFVQRFRFARQPRDETSFVSEEFIDSIRPIAQTIPVFQVFEAHAQRDTRVTPVAGSGRAPVPASVDCGEPKARLDR